jgi:hypothetical protein
MTRVGDLPLRGAGGEPVDFARTIVSHGVAELPPNRVDLVGRTLETTLPVPRGARTVHVTAGGKRLRIETVAGNFAPQLEQTVAHMSRLDEDLSGFYELVREDDLAWCALGAGRMLRAPTVFEDVVKTNRTLIRNLARVRRPLPFQPLVAGGRAELPTEFEISLQGPGGEPVDLYRTFMSHGVADLLPGRVDESERTYTTTLAVSRAQPRTVRISQRRAGFACIEVAGRMLGERATDDLRRSVRRILNWTKTCPSSTRSSRTTPTFHGPLREQAECCELRRSLKPS